MGEMFEWRTAPQMCCSSEPRMAYEPSLKTIKQKPRVPEVGLTAATKILWANRPLPEVYPSEEFQTDRLFKLIRITARQFKSMSW